MARFTSTVSLGRAGRAGRIVGRYLHPVARDSAVPRAPFRVWDWLRGRSISGNLRSYRVEADLPRPDFAQGPSVAHRLPIRRPRDRARSGPQAYAVCELYGGIGNPRTLAQSVSLVRVTPNGAATESSAEHDGVRPSFRPCEGFFSLDQPSFSLLRYPTCVRSAQLF